MPDCFQNKHSEALLHRSRNCILMNMDKRGYPATAAFAFGPEPVQVTCSNCHKTVTTTTTEQNGTCAWVSTLVVCLLCCPCFWIPLVMSSCKDVQHTCPSCGAMLGCYKKL